jgi:predicted metal-dependent phosphoesterase TrpH
VDRYEPTFAEAVEQVRGAGGVASLAHPVRLKGEVAAVLPDLCAAGLNAIEAYHSDHGPAETEQFLSLAARHGLLVTGGSDFHGAAKPGIQLGTGRGGNLQVPAGLLDPLRAA